MSRRTYPIPNKNLSGSEYIQNKRAKQLFSGTSNLAKTIAQQNGNFPLLTPQGKQKPYQGTFGLSGRIETNDKTYCLNTSHSYRDLLAITKGKYLLTPPNISNESIIELKDVSESEKLFNGIYYVYVYSNTTNALYYMNPPYPDPSGNYISNRIEYDVTGNANQRIIVDPSYVLTYLSQSCILDSIVISNIKINNDPISRNSFNRTINLALLSGFQYPSKFSLEYDDGDCINASNDLQSKYGIPVPPTPPDSVVYFVAGGQGTILAYSSNGSVLNASTNGNNIIKSIVSSIKYNGTTFNTWLAVGGNSTDPSGNVIAYSTDGKTWTASTYIDPSGNANDIFTNANGVEWVESLNRWIVVGQGKGATPRSIIYSSDANIWNIGNDPSGNNPFGASGIGTAVATNNLSSPNFKIIAIGRNVNTNLMVSSTNGIVWSPVATPPAFAPTAIANSIIYGGSTWVVGGNSGFPASSPIWYSTNNGVTWVASSVGSSFQPNNTGVCNDIAWNGSYFVAVGSSIFGLSNIVYSLNGIQWLPSNDGNLISPLSVTWQASTPTLEGRWVVVGSAIGIQNGNIMFSTNGIEWTRSLNSSSIFSNSVVSVGSTTNI
jgi:hypothetical protein